MVTGAEALLEREMGKASRRLMAFAGRDMVLMFERIEKLRVGRVDDDEARGGELRADEIVCVKRMFGMGET